MPAVEVKAAEPVTVKPAEVKPVETVEPKPAEPVRTVTAPPEAARAAAPAAAPKAPGAAETAGRKVGGAFLDTFTNALRSKPVQVVASFGLAFIAAGVVIYLAPKALGTLLKAAGASEEQITWITWGLAILIAVIVFVVAWKFLVKRGKQ